MIIKIRYKTDAKKEDTLHWRVIIDNIEYYSSNVIVNVPSWTTNDIIEGIGEKWHITCVAQEIKWEDEKCIIL